MFGENKVRLFWILMFFSGGLFAQPDLEITSSGSPYSFDGDGQVNFIDFEITNNGTLDAGDGIQIDFVLNTSDGPLDFEGTSIGANWDCSDIQNSGCLYQANLPQGGMTTLSIGVIVQPGSFDFAPGVTANVSDVGGNEIDFSNNVAMADINYLLVGAPEIEIVKTIVLSVSSRGPIIVPFGGLFDYQIEVNNIGSGPAASVDLTDMLPAGVEYVSHTETGGNLSCTFVAPTLDCLAPNIPVGSGNDRVNIAVRANGNVGDTIMNTATSSFIDGNSLNNISQASFDIGPFMADLTAGKFLVGPSNVNVGDFTDFEITVTNNGPEDAFDVQMTDTIPAGLAFDSMVSQNGVSCMYVGANNQVVCDTSTLAVGQSATAIFRSEVTGTGSINNTVNVSSTNGAWDPTSNTLDDDANAAVTAGTFVANLDLAMVVDSASYNVGDLVTHDVTLHNPFDATGAPSNVELVITLSPEVTFQAAQENTPVPVGFSCTHDGAPFGGDVTCNSQGNSVPIGTNTLFQVTAFATVPTPDINSQSNAIVMSDFDPDPSNDNASAVFFVNAGDADLLASFTSTSDIYNQGDLVTFDVRAENAMGSSTAPSDAVLTFDLPAETVFQSADVSAAPNWVCSHDGSPAGGSVSCNSGGTPFVQFTFVEFSFNVVAATVSTNAIANVNIMSAANDTVPGNNSDNLVVMINLGSSDFVMQKTVSGTDFALGDSFTYFLTVSNAVTSTANPVDVVIRDQLPVEVSFNSHVVGTNMGTPISCTHDGSPNGGLFSCDTSGMPFSVGEVVTIDINVTASDINPSVNNSATVETLTDPDGNVNNNQDSSVTVNVQGSLDTTLGATKTAEIGGVVVTEVPYGTNYDYVLQVENTGSFPADAVHVSDQLSNDVTLQGIVAPAWNCAPVNLGTTGEYIDCTMLTQLPVGATEVITLNVTAPTTQGVTTINNTMETLGTNTGGTLVSANNTLNLVTPELGITITQTPSPVDPGADLDFDVRYENNGLAPLTGIQMDHMFPVGFVYNSHMADPGIACVPTTTALSCTTSGPQLPGAQWNVSINMTAVSVPLVGQAYELLVTGNAAELSTPVNQTHPVLFSTSEFVATMFSDPTEVAPGGNFIHRLNILNNGNLNFTNVRVAYGVTDTTQITGVSSADMNCSVLIGTVICVNLAPLPPNATFQVDFEINAGQSTGLISGAAGINADGLVRQVNTVTSVVNEIDHDVSILKSVSVSQITSGESFSYSLDVLNRGQYPANNVTVTDLLPAGLTMESFSGDDWSCEGTTQIQCALAGELASGANSQVVLNVQSANVSGVINNTAHVDADQDEDRSNNQSSVSVEVSGGGGQNVADVMITQSVESNDVLSTDPLTWLIEIENNGPDTATNLMLNGQIPVGFEAEMIDVGSGFSCTLLTQSFMCELSSLGNGQIAQISLQGQPNDDFEGLLVSLVDVSASSNDPDPTNNTNSTQVNVTAADNAQADLALTLESSGAGIQQGGSIDVVFKSENLGSDRAVGAKLTGVITGLIDNVQVMNAGQWTCQSSASQFECIYPGDYIVGAQDLIELSINTQQVVQQSQPVTLNASIEAETMDPQPANNMIGFSNDVSRTPTEDEIFGLFEAAVGSGASDTVMRTIRNVSSYCARSYFMAIEGLCEEMIAAARPENSGDIINAMEEITPNEVIGQSSSSAEIISSQFRNIDSRLATLRGGGGSGVSVSGLTGRYGNESIPLGMLAYLNDAPEEGKTATSNINDFVSPWGFFVNGNISMGERDATGRELGFDFDTYGLTAGVDYRFSDTKVAGLALGYANFDSEIEDEAEMKSTAVTLTGYGSLYLRDNLYLDARLSYGRPDFEQSRRINFTLDDIAIDRVARGDTSADQYSVAMSVGYHFNKNAWNITPNASFKYSKTNIDSFSEAGAGDFNFFFAEQEVKSMVWSVGASVSRAISLKNGVIAPQFDFNLSRETENDGGLIEARFIMAPDDEIFFIETDEPDRTFGSAGIGLVFIGANGKQAYINYRSIFGLDGFSQGTINLGARFEF